MKLLHLSIRIAPFLLALLLGAFASGGDPASSQSQGEGGLQWWAIPNFGTNGMPLTATGPGHVDGWVRIRGHRQQ